MENTKTCLYGNKADDVFKTNPITFIFCYCPEMKFYGTLIKHPGFAAAMEKVAMKKVSGIARSSRPGVFSEKGVLENFAKFTEKHLCQSLLFFLKKRLWHGCFSVNFAKFLKTHFFIAHLRWLLLNSLFRRFSKFIVKIREEY